MSFDVLNLSSYEPQRAVEKPNNRGWVGYGEGDLFPQYIHELFMSSVTHNALTYSIAQEFANSVEPPEIIKGHDKICLDLKKQGGFYLEVNYSLLGNLASVKHIPFECMRMEDAENPTKVFYSLDWARPNGKNAPKEYQIFRKDLSGKEFPTQILPVFMFVPGNDTYPKPDYIGGIDWIEMEKSIASYHVNNIRNGFSPVWAIQHHDGEPTPEQKIANRLYYQNNLVGGEGSKVIITYDQDKESGVEFNSFDITDEDKKYEFLSGECTDKIMIAHGVVNPMMFGVAVAGKLGGGSEIEGSDEIFKTRKVDPVTKLLNETYALFKTPTELSAVTMTDEIESFAIDYISEKGEQFDDEWEYIEEEIENPDDEGLLHSKSELSSIAVKLYDASYRNPEDKSDWGDSGLYKLRYFYKGNASDKSRAFCKKMVSLTSEGYVYRYEDIISMGDSGVNGGFAPKGASTYNIFEHKGGVNCHHTWGRRIYFRKRDKGKFLPKSTTSEMENDKKVGNVPFVPQKGVEGTAPIDTPSKGRKLSKFFIDLKNKYYGNS